MHNDRPGMHPQQYNKVPQQINKQFNQPPIPQHMAGPQHIGVSYHPNHAWDRPSVD